MKFFIIVSGSLHGGLNYLVEKIFNSTSKIEAKLSQLIPKLIISEEFNKSTSKIKIMLTFLSRRIWKQFPEKIWLLWAVSKAELENL